MAKKTIFHIFMIAIVFGSISAEADVKFEISAVPITTKDQVINGLNGGEGFQMVLSITFAPSDAKTVYLSTDTNQVWKSIDGGASWRSKNNGYFANGGRSLFVHPKNKNIVFSAGTNGEYVDKVHGNKEPHHGIYRSLDGGEHWVFVQTAKFFKQKALGSLFAVDSRTLNDKDFTIFAGTHSGDLLVSKDSGSSWKMTQFSMKAPILEVLEIPNEPGALFIASENGLYRYKDKAIDKVGKGLPRWPRSIAVSSDAPDVVYAVVGNSVYISSNGGRNFELSYHNNSIGSIGSIAVSPTNHKIAIFIKNGSNAGPYYTEDGGGKWSKAESISEFGLSCKGDFYFPSPIAFDPDDSRIAITSSNGCAKVFISKNNGRSWNYSGSGFRGARLNEVKALTQKSMLFAVTDHGLWRTDDEAATFRKIDFNSKGSHSVGGIGLSNNNLVASVGDWRNKRLVISKDGGINWEDKNIFGSLNNIAEHNKKRDIVYAGEYVSRDSGIDWKKLPYKIVCVDPNDNDVVYAVEQVEGGSQLLTSKDLGDHWEKYAKPIPVKMRSIHKIEKDPFRRSRIYVATSRGLWINDQQKWKRINGILPDKFNGKNVSSVLPHPHWPGLVFLGKGPQGKGMSNGVFYSLDYGENWQQIPNVEISRSTIWSLNVNKYDDAIYAGTSHGIYKIKVHGLQ